MDSSACSHLFVHHPRPEQSEGQSTRAPRARLPLSLGDITASQCRSHFKLISLCMMFFKSFLNKTEIQRLFPGLWEQRRGPECALKKLLREGCTGAFCSCLTHLLASNQMSSLQVPQEYERVTVTRFLWRQGTGAVAWDTCSSSVLARENQSSTASDPARRPASGPGSSASGRLSQNGAAKGLGNDLV